jgi:hypothetical protein
VFRTPKSFDALSALIYIILPRELNNARWSGNQKYPHAFATTKVTLGNLVLPTQPLNNAGNKSQSCVSVIIENIHTKHIRNNPFISLEKICFQTIKIAHVLKKFSYIYRTVNLQFRHTSRQTSILSYLRVHVPGLVVRVLFQCSSPS